MIPASVDVSRRGCVHGAGRLLPAEKAGRANMTKNENYERCVDVSRRGGARGWALAQHDKERVLRSAVWVFRGAAGHGAWRLLNMTKDEY